MVAVKGLNTIVQNSLNYKVGLFIYKLPFVNGNFCKSPNATQFIVLHVFLVMLCSEQFVDSSYLVGE